MAERRENKKGSEIGCFQEEKKKKKKKPVITPNKSIIKAEVDCVLSQAIISSCVRMMCVFQCEEIAGWRLEGWGGVPEL